MLLPVGQVTQPRGHAERLVQLPELDHRLDQFGRDRKHTRLLDALALGVLPHRAQAVRRPLRLVRQQPRDPQCTQALEPVPAEPAGLRGSDRRFGPSLRFAG